MQTQLPLLLLHWPCSLDEQEALWKGKIVGIYIYLVGPEWNAEAKIATKVIE